MNKYYFLIFLFFSSFFMFGFLGGDGSLINPYQISTPEDLASISDDLNASYVLMNNISLGGVDWKPIEGFNGSFDGQNNVIFDVFVNLSNESRSTFEVLLDQHNNDVGFFGSVVTSSVSNLSLVNVSIFGEYNVGGLAGSSLRSNFSNVHVSGYVNGLDFVGGLVGKSHNSLFNNVSFSGEISGKSSIGGLLGESTNPLIRYSSFNGTINGEQVIGGLIGISHNFCSIKHSSVYGNVNQMITMLEGRSLSIIDFLRIKEFYARGFDYRVNDFIGIEKEPCLIENSTSELNISYIRFI